MPPPTRSSPGLPSQSVQEMGDDSHPVSACMLPSLLAGGQKPLELLKFSEKSLMKACFARMACRIRGQPLPPPPPPTSTTTTTTTLKTDLKNGKAEGVGKHGRVGRGGGAGQRHGGTETEREILMVGGVTRFTKKGGGGGCRASVRNRQDKQRW